MLLPQAAREAHDAVGRERRDLYVSRTCGGPEGRGPLPRLQERPPGDSERTLPGHPHPDGTGAENRITRLIREQLVGGGRESAREMLEALEREDSGPLTCPRPSVVSRCAGT